MRHLPTELIEVIIDFLHLNRRALANCSLVGRHWLPASRFHLFRIVCIFPSNVHSFINLLAHPSSTIAHHVHKLEILLHVLSTFDESAEIPVLDIIAPHLKRFVALDSISLSGFRWVPVSGENLSREFGRVGNMELTRVFCNFATWWFTFNFTIAERGPSSFSSSLRALYSTFNASHLPIFNGTQQPSSWLPIVAQLPAINEVGLSFIGINQLPAVKAMLKSAGQSMHTIKLSFSGYRYNIQSLICDCVDLTHNTNLRSLSIQNLDLRKSKEFAGNRSFYKIIERISSHCITHIHIGVYANDCADLIWLNFKKIEAELNHPRFSQLQEVCVDIHGAVGIEDKAAWVCREMPSLDHRNVLTSTIG